MNEEKKEALTEYSAFWDEMTKHLDHLAEAVDDDNLSIDTFDWLRYTRSAEKNAKATWGSKNDPNKVEV